uniref:DUF3110 domain-containing protein n=1 Tax=Cyanothece sp. (strain PCC 7425 / ATCC 29141) TaxID=395961 RepID=B8HK29_CYAP4
MQVYVLLFNARTENEGIHSLQLGDRNIILMFESEDDATRYALLLEAQDFIAPSVEAIAAEEVEEFCRSAGYGFQLVPQGFVPSTAEERLLLSPPETNVPSTDWQAEPQAEQMEQFGANEIELNEIEKMRRRLEDLL